MSDSRFAGMEFDLQAGGRESLTSAVKIREKTLWKSLAFLGKMLRKNPQEKEFFWLKNFAQG